jgi:glycosyltransferase involved in cell wall biosynthesis
MGALVEELLEAGHEVQWFVAPIDLAHAEVVRLQARGALVEKLPREPKGYVRAAALRRKIDRVLEGERGLVERVRSFAPDFVYLNQGGTWCGAFGHFAEVLRDFPGRYAVICHLNQPSAPFSSEVRRKVGEFVDHANRVFVNSSYMLDLAQRQLARDIPNAWHYHLPHRFSFSAPIRWPELVKPQLAFVGRLDVHHKGLDVALEAFARVPRSGQECSLSLYGVGPDREYLEGLADYLGVRDRVIFKGQTSDIEKVWHENEILFMPSRHEGCSVAMTEAIGFGRPVIATAVGGAPEWIKDGATGFLAAAPTVGLVTEALRRAVAERSRWREMGEAAHRKFKATMPDRPATVFLEAL